jgi:hypothetical protein
MMQYTKRYKTVLGSRMAYIDEGAGAYRNQDLIGDYAAWLPSAKVPKLFIDAEPGFIVTGKIREWVRGWANQQIVSVKSKHFVQEDAPDEIGRTISDWYARLAGSSVLVA